MTVRCQKGWGPELIVEEYAEPDPTPWQLLDRGPLNLSVFGGGDFGLRGWDCQRGEHDGWCMTEPVELPNGTMARIYWLFDDRPMSDIEHCLMIRCQED